MLNVSLYKDKIYLVSMTGKHSTLQIYTKYISNFVYVNEQKSSHEEH